MLAVTVVGVVITVAVRTVDNERSSMQRNEQLRLEVLREILVCYAQAKCPPRTPRSAYAMRFAMYPTKK